MGAKVTFNELTRIIEIDLAPDANDEVFIDVKIDLYSDGKEDWVANENLRRLIFPISAVGGNSLPGSKQLGSTFFIRSDWKIAPYEASHRLIINGNFYSEDGEDPFLDTAGTYTVRIMQQVSSLVDSTIQQLPEIEYASFNGGITIDELSSNVGTVYPTGTPQAPVNNWPDALLIAIERGFNKFFVNGDATLDGSFDLTDYIIVGESPAKTLVTISGLATTSGMEIVNSTVTGILDGENYLSECTVMDLEYVNGRLFNCGLIGDIELSGNANAVLNDCYTVDQDNPPVLDMGGTGQSLVMVEYTGLLTLHNLSDTNQNVGIGLSAGAIVLDNTITAGNVIISGVGILQDNSGGTTTVDTSALLSNDSIAEEVWQGVDGADVRNQIEYIKDVESGRWKMDGNQMIFYKADNMTEVVRFNLYNQAGAPAMENIYERERDNSSDNNWKYPQVMQMNFGSIADGALADVVLEDTNRLQLNEVVGDAFDFVFFFEGVLDINLKVDIVGYYEGNPAHNVKISIHNLLTHEWEDLTVDTQDFPDNNTDQTYSFNLPTPRDTYRSSNGDIRLKIKHESNGSTGHYFWLNKMELNAQ